MTYIMVDIESDGPIPGDYSMISIGAVVADNKLDKTFRRDLKPISDNYRKEALEICGVTRQETLAYPDAQRVMKDFEKWIDEVSDGKPRFISDNNGFDWMFLCWYFHHFCGRNPFGYSSTNLGSLYKGYVKDMTKNFKHLRETVHTHDPLDDAIGNAEAFLKIREMMDLDNLQTNLIAMTSDVSDFKDENEIDATQDSISDWAYKILKFNWVLRPLVEAGRTTSDDMQSVVDAVDLLLDQPYSPETKESFFVPDSVFYFEIELLLKWLLLSGYQVSNLEWIEKMKARQCFLSLEEYYKSDTYLTDTDVYQRDK